MPGQSGHRAALIAALVVSGLAGVFWVVFAIQSADSALTRVPLLDESWYLNEAARLRAEGLPGNSPFVMSPGYPLLVLATGGAAPTAEGILVATPWLLITLQALGWLACGLLAGAVVLRMGPATGRSPRRALIAALITTLLVLLYRPAAIYARTILLEIPLTLLVTASLAVLVWRRDPGWPRFLVAGLLLGLAALLRAHVLALLVVMVWVAWAPGPDPRPRRRLAVAGLLILALLPAGLAAVHNSRLAGRPTGPSLNGGVNLYLGLMPEGQGLFTTVAGFDLEADPSGRTFLERRLGRPLAGPAEADRVWLAEARRLVESSPGRSLGLWLRKIWLHLQGWEVSQVTPLAAWPAAAPVLRLLVVPWWLLVVLGGTGLTVVLLGASPSWSGAGRRIWPWAGALVFLMLVQSLFFVVTRYRLVLWPMLAILAGAGVLGLPDLRPWTWRRRGLPLALVAGGLALAAVPWGLRETRRLWSGLEAFNLASRELVLAQVDDDPDRRQRVDELLARTCTVAAGRVEPWRLRALNLARAGRADEALRVLTEGTLLVADPAPLEWVRIGLLREVGRLDEAEAMARAYLQEHPDDPDMLHDLAVLQGQRGRWRDAAATAERLKTVAPTDHRGWLDLGVALARLGRPEAAAATFREGLEQVPEGPARDLLAVNLARLGETSEDR